MKMKYVVAALSLASLVSFTASAASLVTNQEAQEMNLQSMNQTISISGRNGDQTDLRQALSHKAEAQGAGHYRIIENHLDNTYHVTAELYK